MKAENPKDALAHRKPDLSLWPPAATILGSLALTEGAAKYGRYNWRQTRVRASVYVAAIQRHLAAYADGEDLDQSGAPHLAHILASAAILIDAGAMGLLEDDRPPAGPAANLLAVWTRPND